MFGRKSASGSIAHPVPPQEQKRAAYRASVEFPVAYTFNGRLGSLRASANELSAGGLRLLCDEDLPVGSRLDLRFTLPYDRVHTVFVEKTVKARVGDRGAVARELAPPRTFPPMTIRGTIVFPFFDTKRRAFAYGVRFEGPDEGTLEEIARFIHLWQLQAIRERAGQARRLR